MFDQDLEASQLQALDLLGLDPLATAQDAAFAYRKLASQYHPDRVADLPDEFQEVARQRMSEINQAYEAIRFALPSVVETKDASKAPPAEPTVAEKTDPKPAPNKQVDAQFVKFACPSCSAKIKVPAEMRGKNGQCTRCKQKLTVPTHVELRCENCGQRNRLPNVLQRKRAICRKCYGSLARAKPTS